MIGVFKKKPELPEYLAHYGMHRAPFSAAIENDMYYVEPARKQRLDVLLHLTQYTNELLVVTGEQGTGKTMFLQQFINSAGEHWKICAMQGHKMMTEEQFLQQVYLGFGIAHASIHKTTMLTNLKKRLDSQLEQALPVILLVDDAHLFSSKVLSLILELASIRNVTSGTSVRVILFSEPQIKIILAEPELDEKHRLIVRKIDLPPLDESHTGDYLYHRLSQAGMATEQFLTQQTIRKIYKQSNGIPARINEAADKLLFETTPIIRRTSNVQAQKKMAGMKYVVIVVLLGIALASYLFQKYFNTTIRDTSEATETEQTTAQPAETVTEKTVTPLKLPELDSTKEIKVDNEIQAEQSTRPPDAIDPMQSLKEELASKTAEPAAAPEPAPAQPAAAEKIQYEQDAPAETQSITPLGPAPTIAIQQPPAEVLPKDAKWVMQQNPEHFTLQLVTGRQQATIDRFIAQHGLQPQMLAYFYSYRNEKNWHNLIYGVYPDRAEAAAAIKQLPPELAAIKPWIRQYRSIQSEIAQVR